LFHGTQNYDNVEQMMHIEMLPNVDVGCVMGKLSMRSGLFCYVASSSSSFINEFPPKLLDVKVVPTISRHVALKRVAWDGFYKLNSVHWCIGSQLHDAAMHVLEPYRPERMIDALWIHMKFVLLVR
jgi:hypothetical protein